MVLRNVVPRQGTEMMKWMGAWYPKKGLRNVVPRQGTEMKIRMFYELGKYILRNVVPRQGTEIHIILLYRMFHRLFIEKCSSPTGDGNF